jgi:hypothetical protein
MELYGNNKERPSQEKRRGMDYRPGHTIEALTHNRGRNRYQQPKGERERSL